MGYWKQNSDGDSFCTDPGVTDEAKMLLWGDEPADAVSDAVFGVIVAFMRDLGRLPSKAEMAAGFKYTAAILEDLPERPEDARPLTDEQRAVVAKHGWVATGGNVSVSPQQAEAIRQVNEVREQAQRTPPDPRTLNPYTGDPMTAVVIDRPGKPILRYGPIGYTHQAEQWITYLNWSRTSTAMPKGTTWRILPYDPDVEHVDPDTIPTDSFGIAEALIADDTSGVDAFPDLWLLLQCILGDAEASTRWKQAMTVCAQLENDEDDPEA